MWLGMQLPLCQQRTVCKSIRPCLQTSCWRAASPPHGFLHALHSLQHPARDAHDTFFTTLPATSDTFPEDYLARVKVGACLLLMLAAF